MCGTNATEFPIFIAFSLFLINLLAAQKFHRESSAWHLTASIFCSSRLAFT